MDKTTFYEKIEEDLIFDDINEVKVNSAGRKIEPLNPSMETPPRRVGAFFYKVKKLKIPQSLYKKEWIIKGRRRLSYILKMKKDFSQNSLKCAELEKFLEMF